MLNFPFGVNSQRLYLPQYEELSVRLVAYMVSILCQLCVAARARRSKSGVY